MKTKLCSNPKCHKEKSLSEFSKDKSRKDGYNPYCKICNKVYRDENIEKRKQYQKELKRKYPWKAIFNSIKQRCDNSNHTFYKYYRLIGIKNFLTLEDVKFLYIKYKANLMIKPSIDRKNSKKNYTLSNCQFIELEENSAKDKRKIILQFNLDGNFIKEWHSLMEVERQLNIYHANIIKCIKGERNHTGGFKWLYKLEK